MNSLCPECRKEFACDIDAADPPSQAHGKYLVFCPECAKAHYSGLHRLGVAESFSREDRTERDRRDPTLANLGSGYTNEEMAFLRACDRYRTCLGRSMSATDYLRVMKLLNQ